MGYSYTNDAGRILDAINREIARQNPGGCSNEWKDPKSGRRYFYEHQAKDQPDGGIRGSIHRFEKDSNLSSRVGRFNITGDGRLMDAPAHFYELLERDARQRERGRK